MRWAGSEQRTHTLTQCLSRGRDLGNMETASLLTPSPQLQKYVRYMYCTFTHCSATKIIHLCPVSKWLLTEREEGGREGERGYT